VSSATCDDRHRGDEVSGVMFIRIGWRYGRTRNHRPGHGVHHIQYQAEIKPPISNSTRN
jgi:hypothetical protein